MHLLANIAVFFMNAIIPVLGSWPRGTYGIPKARTGCPTTGAWVSGQRIQRTEFGSKSSEGSHLAGSSSDPANRIMQEFCMKSETDDIDEDPVDFMPGRYCVLKMKNTECPSRFREGWIYWDDAALLLFADSVQNYTGTLPDGEYNSNTRILYCCRDDGDSRLPIEMPSNAPFFLLKYGPECQQVVNMGVTEEWILWVDEKTVNMNRQFGAYPEIERGQSRMPHTKLFYCYYTPRKGSNIPSVITASNGFQTLIVAAYVLGATVGFVLIIAIILTCIQRVLLLRHTNTEHASCQVGNSSSGGSGRHAVIAVPHNASQRALRMADQPPSYDVALLDSTRREPTIPSTTITVMSSHGRGGRSRSRPLASTPQMLTTDDVIRPPSYDDVIHEKSLESS